jgi:transposase
MRTIITDEQRAKIIELSNAGYSNWQMSMECGMKQSTLQYWKRRMRNEGIAITGSAGRPKLGSKKAIKLISTMEELKKQESEDIIPPQPKPRKIYTPEEWMEYAKRGEIPPQY